MKLAAVSAAREVRDADHEHEEEDGSCHNPPTHNSNISNDIDEVKKQRIATGNPLWPYKSLLDAATGLVFYLVLLPCPLFQATD
jgi:hypothetical protein